MTERRWRYLKVRRWLRAASRVPLDRWIRQEAQKLSGLVLNLGSGEDLRQYGCWTIRVDAYAPICTVRADLGRTLPFQDTVFEGALCTEVIEHVPDVRLVLSELARVLRPGALALITIPFVFHYHSDPRDLLRLTPVGLRTELERAGFAVEMTAGVGNKLIALLLLLEALHPIAKVIVRVGVLILTPLLQLSSIRNGTWSDWAANSVAIARKPSRKFEMGDGAKSTVQVAAHD